MAKFCLKNKKNILDLIKEKKEQCNILENVMYLDGDQCY